MIDSKENKSKNKMLKITKEMLSYSLEGLLLKFLGTRPCKNRS